MPLQKLNDWVAVDPSSLRHVVQIQSEQSGAQDATGQYLDSSWATILTTRASIDVVKQNELYQTGAGFTSQVSHSIKIRYQSVTIAPGMRVVFGDKIFLVQTIENVSERNRILKLQVLALNEDSN
jgi:SPP1 family predicted phage head-tail adaptor